MGSVNQYSFIQNRAEEFAGPYLEVGAKDYGTTQDLRGLFAGRGRYVGVDLEPGRGVDITVDLAGAFDEVDAKLEGARFGTIFCLSVLEHCRQPFAMAENLTRLLATGGKICVSVPFAFKFHAYPCDYWRFTHEGIKQLFPELEFRLEDGVSATSVPGEFKPLGDRVGRIDFSYTSHRRAGRILRGVLAKALRLLGRMGVLGWLAGYPYVLAPTDILMIGMLRPSQTSRARGIPAGP